MKVVIFVGGYGTRIRDVSENTPKPMLPICGTPILWHIMKYYSMFGFKDFILCLGYKGHKIKEYFLHYNQFVGDFKLNLKTKKTENLHNHIKEDWTITFVETGLNSMTGARLYKLKEHLKNEENFCLTYGDGLGDINLKQLVDFHKSHNKLMTVTSVHPPARFGLLEIKNNTVFSFNEKKQSSEGTISAGFFVCNNKIFNYLDDDNDLILERSPMENIVKDRQLMAYQHNGFWQPMDTSREYQYLNELWQNNTAPWKIW